MSGQIQHLTAFIALGANMPFEGLQGPELLAAAITALGEASLAPRAVSSVWQTEAWPHGSGQPDYFNAVVEIDAQGMTPEGVYAVLAQIERRFGRERREQWAPRTLDLDILSMDGFIGAFGGIKLPHQRMGERAFVLAPLAEIAPNWRHPVSGMTASALLAGLPCGYRYQKVGAIPSS